VLQAPGGRPWAAHAYPVCRNRALPELGPPIGDGGGSKITTEEAHAPDFQNLAGGDDDLGLIAVIWP